MDELIRIILYTGAAGACIPLGGFLGKIERLRPMWLEREFRHFVIAFGGGILLAAVALVLVPEGTEYFPSPIESVLVLVVGGISFFLLERSLGHYQRVTPQFSALLLDYVPESLALGGMFAVDARTAPLLALLIGLQNVPEGFNAYRELKGLTKARSSHILLFMFALVPIGPILAVIGMIYLSQNSALLGAVMLYASGGILYLIFQDIAPQSRLNRHWLPPLGAVMGFSLAMLGQMYITGG